MTEWDSGKTLMIWDYGGAHWRLIEYRDPTEYDHYKLAVEYTFEVRANADQWITINSTDFYR